MGTDGPAYRYAEHHKSPCGAALRSAGIELVFAGVLFGCLGLVTMWLMYMDHSIDARHVVEFVITWGLCAAFIHRGVHKIRLAARPPLIPNH